MPTNQPRILVAAGGTGGHVFPAIAIADEVRTMKNDAHFLFVGTKGKIEARVVPQHGFAFAAIWISGLRRSIRLDNLLFPVKVLVSLVQSFFLIKRFRPDVALGTGGYVCGPVLFMASLLGIPTVIHESNSYPGVTTRMLAGRATQVFTAFDTTAHWLKRTAPVILTGTPTRKELGTVSHKDGAEFFHLDPSKKTVLIFGGSLGAESINRAAEILMNTTKGIQVIWQTGAAGEAFANKFAQHASCWVGPFIEKMEYAYAAADVVVCRAGATTIAELTCVGKPAILIPYPFAAADHQTFNARALADAGAGMMIADRDVVRSLSTEVPALLQDESKCTRMSAACRALGKPEAGRDIAQRIESMIAKS